MNPTREEKLHKLKFFFASNGKKVPSDTEANALIDRLDKLGLLSTVVAYGLGLAIYGVAGAMAGSLLGFNPLAAAGAFLIVRLALNYHPREEEAFAKVKTEQRLITQAIADAPSDPSFLSEILGQAQYENPDTTPKA